MNMCSWIAPDVILIDGTVVSSNSEAWRHQCEAIYILSLPSKEIRQEILGKIGQRRGGYAKIRLETTIIEVWQARRTLALANPASA